MYLPHIGDALHNRYRGLVGSFLRHANWQVNINAPSRPGRIYGGAPTVHTGRRRVLWFVKRQIWHAICLVYARWNALLNMKMPMQVP
jgi:hypothetical protein